MTEPTPPAQQTAPTDETEPATVNVSEPWTRAYWARRFEASVERVEEAVRTVGDDPARVAAHLGKPWPFDKTGIV